MKLYIAMALALIGTQAINLNIMDENDANQMDAADAGEVEAEPAADTGASCGGNKSGNCVNIDLKFDVKVGDGSADDADSDSAGSDAGVEIKETVALGDDTDVGNGMTWADIKAAAVVDGYKDTEAYTGLSDKNKAIVDALIAASADGDIPEGSSTEITYTLSAEEVQALITPASDDNADEGEGEGEGEGNDDGEGEGNDDGEGEGDDEEDNTPDDGKVSVTRELGPNTMLPLGDKQEDGSYANLAWSDIEGQDNQFIASNASQVETYMLTPKYMAMTNFQKGEFDALVKAQAAAEADSNTLSAADLEIRFFVEQPVAGEEEEGDYQLVNEKADPLGDGDRWEKIKNLTHDADLDSNATNWEEFKAGFISKDGDAFAALTMSQQNVLDDYRIAQEHNGREWTDAVGGGSVICKTQDFTRLSDFAVVESYDCDTADCNMWKNLKVLAMESDGNCTECVGCSDDDNKLYLALCDAQSGKTSVGDLDVDSTGTASYREYQGKVYAESIYAQ